MDACQFLPKEWVHGTTCPICGGISLSIEPQAAGADQFRCNGCASTFEIATDGLHVRMVNAPAHILDQTAGQWLAPAAIRRLTFENLSSNQVSGECPIIVQCNPEELRAKAFELHKLGNSISAIASTLHRSFGATDEQVQSICTALTQEIEQRQRASLNMLLLVFGFLLVIGALVVIFFSPLKVSAQRLLGLPAVQQKIEEESGFMNEADLPAPLRALIPAGANIVKPMEIVVKSEQSNGWVTACPASPGEAARIFGGDMQSWTKSENGWYLITPDTTIIRVPEGMYAGYFVFSRQPEMRNVIGPARMENVNFVAISCR